MAKKKEQPKNIWDMSPDEQRAELDRLRAEEAKQKAHTARLEATGFYRWRETSPANVQYGDVWAAAYAKGMEDAAKTVEGLDTPSPELQDEIAAAIREEAKGE